jgi:hypothetical protein
MGIMGEDEDEDGDEDDDEDVKLALRDGGEGSMAS